jgi:hypothetical protein
MDVLIYPIGYAAFLTAEALRTALSRRPWTWP